MATSVPLPALGESVTEGTVTRWLKQVGDSVAVDEPLLEVSTDKVDTEIPSPVAGTLLEIKADEDETVEVGAELAVIGDEGESAGSDDSSSGESPAQEETQEETADEAEAAAAEPEEPADEPASEAQSGGSGGSGGGAGTPVTLPALGESVTEGTVTRWLKQVGDEVAVDEPLLEVSTDKVDTEIPSPVAGTLLEIKADEDETVEVGGELAVIGSGEPGGSGADTGGGASGAQAGGDDGAPGSGVTAPEAEDSGEAATGDVDAPEAASQQATPDPTPAAQQTGSQTDGSSAPSGSGDATPDRTEAKQAAPAQTRDGAQGSQQPAPPEGDDPVPTQEPNPGQERTSGGAPGQGQGSSGQGGPGQGESGEGGPYVTPLVRKMAAEHGVDLSSLEGSGVGGRIRKQDVLDAAARQKEAAQQDSSRQEGARKQESAPAAQDKPSAGAPVAPSPLRGKTEPMTRLRKVIAKRMVESLQVSAQLTTVVEVDVTSIARLRDAAKADFAAREGVKLSFMPFFAKAAIDALKAHPSLNASLDTEKGEVTYFDHENLSVAVDTEKGLLTPVIKDAGDLSIAGLARKIADVAERTRTNKIGPDELAGGTFTLTNTGSRGALFDTPIINQPQVAILGTGSVVKRAVVIDDANLGETIAVRRMVYLALTYDHRIVDGADAARFLTDVKQRLEAGQFEV
jgi:2-oxoglutarate dehydrogenase E2 component (dihydrolipoamide succinyltransferase)